MPQTDTPSEQPERFKAHLVRPLKDKAISAKPKGSSDSSRELWVDAADHFADSDWLE